jgi:hypothetical protein
VRERRYTGPEVAVEPGLLEESPAPEASSGAVDAEGTAAESLQGEVVVEGNGQDEAVVTEADAAAGEATADADVAEASTDAGDADAGAPAGDTQA